MKNEFTAIIEKDNDWYISYCAEVEGANGQGHTIEESLQSLSEAITLILEFKRDNMLKSLPNGAIKRTVVLA